MSRTKKIAVIGGGVSGITTSLTLQLMGFDTTCYAEHLVNRNAPRDPRFASLYPAASIIPHSVHSDHLDTIFPASLSIFDAMYKARFNFVALYRHFEIFEFKKEFPAYTRYLHNLADVNSQDESTVPRRPGADTLYGWSFDCFVAKWPGYMKQLYELYKQAGGQIINKKLEPESIECLPTDIIVNCSGAWSTELFSDPVEQEFIRGHLVHVSYAPPVTLPDGALASYNYTPDTSVYASPQGQPSDVYFYPVNGKWILGGSRQIGTLDKHGNWNGKTHDETVPINGIDIPRPIIELNKKLLKNSFNQSLGNKSDISAYIGYRHNRKERGNGLRLEKSTEYNKTIIHNYGHGGAGVTLSWGAALKVLHFVLNETGSSSIDAAGSGDSQLDTLHTNLRQNYFQLFEP